MARLYNTVSEGMSMVSFLHCNKLCSVDVNSCRRSLRGLFLQLHPSGLVLLMPQKLAVASSVGEGCYVY